MEEEMKSVEIHVDENGGTAIKSNVTPYEAIGMLEVAKQKILEGWLD